MSNMFGGNPESMAKAMEMMGMATMIMAICMVLFALIYMYEVMHKANFANMPDYGIGQRGDVIAAVPSYEETSLRQKVDSWTKNQTSELTGTRDVPAFFGDYGLDANRRSNGSAISTAREGFEGKKDDELAKALRGSQ
jgi:hypothetical protein